MTRDFCLFPLPSVCTAFFGWMLALTLLAGSERFRRHVVHARPGVFVMFDDLEAAKPATFQWLLHAYDRIAVDQARQILNIRREPAAMEVRLLLPADLAFSQTDRYEPEPERLKPGEIENTWHLTAATSEASDTARFLTVFAPHRSDSNPPVLKAELIPAEGAIGVRLELAGGAEEIVVFRTRDGTEPVSCGGVRSDGRVFALGRAADGVITRRLLFGGNNLEETGQ